MRLSWDNIGERLYETGVSKCVLYPMVHGSYPLGVAWNGITSVTETLSGSDPTSIYADDMKYLELRAAEDFGATLEAYNCPREFARCDGTVEPVPGLHIGQQRRHAFGLCYRTILGNDVAGGDYGYKLHLIYNATVSPAERTYQTINDSPEPISFSWEMTTTPTVVSRYKPTAFVIVDSTKCLPAHLQELENILYGTDEEDPRLPLPDEVKDIMGGACSFFYIERPSGELKYDGPGDIPVDFYMHIYGDEHLYYMTPEDTDTYNVYLDDGHLYIEEVNNGN